MDKGGLAEMLLVWIFMVESSFEASDKTKLESKLPLLRRGRM